MTNGLAHRLHSLLTLDSDLDLGLDMRFKIDPIHGLDSESSGTVDVHKGRDLPGQKN